MYASCQHPVFADKSVFKGDTWLHLVNPALLPLIPAAACLSCHLTCLCAMSSLSARHRLGRASRSVRIPTPAVRGRLTPCCPALSPGPRGVSRCHIVAAVRPPWLKP